jgi:CreA protein
MKKVLVIGGIGMFVLLVGVISVFAVLRDGRTAGTEIGSVNTHFKMGGSDGISVEAIEDPQVENVVCSLSRARVGGASGALGVAEDKSDAHVSCGLLGPVKFHGTLAQQEDVVTEKLNATTKTLHLTRMVDKEHNTLSYLVYSDRITDGSPKHDVSLVVIPRETPIPVR